MADGAACFLEARMDSSRPILLSRMDTRVQEVRCFAKGEECSLTACVWSAAVVLAQCCCALSAYGSCVKWSPHLPMSGVSGEWLPRFQAPRWQSRWRKPECRVNGQIGASSTAGDLVRQYQSR